MADEISAADDEVFGAVELEEKRLAGSQRAEVPRSAGLPKVDFIRYDARQVLIPALVCDADPDFHRAGAFGGWRRVRVYPNGRNRRSAAAIESTCGAPVILSRYFGCSKNRRTIRRSKAMPARQKIRRRDKRTFRHVRRYTGRGRGTHRCAYREIGYRLFRAHR